MRREILEQKTIVEENLSGRCSKIKNCKYLKSSGVSVVDIEDISDHRSTYCLDDYLNCPLNEEGGK